MHCADDQRFNQLCKQASVELDGQKLMHLIEEINRLLEEEEPLKRADTSKAASA